MRPVLSLQSSLDKLQEDIGKTLEKVSSREKYINNQLEPLIQEYRSAQAKLSEVRMDFKPSPLSQCAINKSVFSTRQRSATSRPVEE